MFRKKKFEKIFKNNVAIFLYLKKNSVEIRFIFEKEKSKKFLKIMLRFFYIWKKIRLKFG